MTDNDSSDQVTDDLGKIQDILFGQQQRQTLAQLGALEAQFNERVMSLEQANKEMNDKLQRIDSSKVDRLALSDLLQELARKLAS